MDLLLHFDAKSSIISVKNTSYNMSTTNLMDLPTELHELIIYHLEFPSNSHLKHTNHYFDSLVKEIDIYEAEKSDYAELHGLWACKECKLLLPSSQFSDKNKRGLRTKTGRKADKRFCVPCGVKTSPNGRSLYSPGHRIVIDGTHHLICKNCLRFKKCQKNFLGLCDECFEKQVSVSTSASTSASMSARIQQARLQAEALKERIRRRAAELEHYSSD